MKKLILAALLFIVAGMTAMAQLPSFTFGIKGGVNYSSLKTKNDLTDQNSVKGYQAGIFSRVGAAGIYFQPELYLGSKGNEFVQIEDNNGTDISAKGNVKFTSLEFGNKTTLIQSPTINLSYLKQVR
jgi:hypothetical protein